VAALQGIKAQRANFRLARSVMTEKLDGAADPGIRVPNPSNAANCPAMSMTSTAAISRPIERSDLGSLYLPNGALGPRNLAASRASVDVSEVRMPNRKKPAKQRRSAFLNRGVIRKTEGRFAKADK
jgi:hypothetical protein